MKPIAHLVTPALLAAAFAGAAHAQLLREPPRGEAVERHLPGEIEPTQWVLDPAAVNAQAGDRIELREVAAERLETVKLVDLVPPIRPPGRAGRGGRSDKFDNFRACPRLC